MYSFSDIDGTSYDNRPNKTIFEYDLKDRDIDKDVLLWLNGELKFLQDHYEDTTERMRRNLALYKGIQYQSQDTRGSVRDTGEDRARTFKKIAVPILHDLAKSRTAKIIKYRPGYEIIPSNDELNDKVAAKMVNNMVKHIWYVNNFEGEKSLKLATQSQVLGESYLFTDWNPDMGPLHPTFKEAKKENKDRIPKLDSRGEQVMEDGTPQFVDMDVNVGDVEYRLKLACEVWPEIKDDFTDCNYIFEENICDITSLRKKYPKKYNEIKSKSGEQIYDYTKMTTRPMRDGEIKVYTFWLKRTSLNKDGRKIVFTNDCLLESVEFPFSHTELPCVRYTDVDLPGETRGLSFFDLVKGLSGTYNNLINLVLRNQIMVTHPKWMMPVGAANIQDLGNDITVVQYKGLQPPTLVQSNPTPSETFNFIEKIKGELEQSANVFGVSRGQPPAGIKAGIALQFLDEQEQERYNEAVAKWGEMIKNIVKQTISVAADYYDESDERTIKVLGSNNAWMTEFFDTSTLSSDYDVRVANASALPNNRAARTQYLLDLSEKYPNEVPPSHVLEMLEIGQAEKYIDSATRAIQTAQAENEKLQKENKKELTPEAYEDHFKHWVTHTNFMYSYQFKYSLPKNVQKRFEEHVMGHEYYLWEKSQTNPLLAEKLASLDTFPMFFKPPIPQAQPAPEAPMPEAQPMQGPFVDEQLPVQDLNQQPIAAPMPPIQQQTEPMM